MLVRSMTKLGTERIQIDIADAPKMTMHCGGGGQRTGVQRRLDSEIPQKKIIAPVKNVPGPEWPKDRAG